MQLCTYDVDIVTNKLKTAAVRGRLTCLAWPHRELFIQWNHNNRTDRFEHYREVVRSPKQK